VPDGTVLQVLQKGYIAGDQLLRPALVKVSMA
jgi:molecular chaperone GrpE (heat shock protein)